MKSEKKAFMSTKLAVKTASRSLDYVDSKKSVTGYSMGGLIEWVTVQYYGSQYNVAIEAAKVLYSDDGKEVTVQEQAKEVALNKGAAEFFHKSVSNG